MFALALCLAVVLPLQAQVPNCATITNAGLQWECVTLAQTATIVQPRLGLAAAGGNPLPGGASTLGMRLGSTPRVSADLRVTGTHFTMPSVSPQISQFGNGSARSSLLLSAVSAEAAVGVLSGMNPAPTVGGVGSLDLLASAGVVANPGHDFQKSAWSGALGVRLGVLRESFTAPGVTLSGMYRRIGSSSVGLPGLTSALRHGVQMGPTSDWSFRGVVGKRLFALGTAAGIGLDRYSSEVTLVNACLDICFVNNDFSVAGPLTQTRSNAFLDLTYTSLVFNGVLEAGWQRGGSNGGSTITSLSGYEDLVTKGAPFLSIALRLTI